METRQLKEHERQDAINLSDKTFRNHEQKSMGEAFPSLFSPSMIGHSFGAFDDGELVSFMGLVPSVIRIGETKLNVYSLGSVCTAEEHRKKGLASQLLDKVFNYIDSSDASLLLVSGDRSLYTRVNCCHFGRVTKFNVRSGKVDGKIENQIREMKNEDLLQMNQIAQQRSITYEQSVADLQMMLHTEAYASCFNQTHKTLIFEQNGKVSSYLVLGVPGREKPKQKGKMIEWAGKANEMKHLLSFALKTYELEEIVVAVPWHDQQLENELKDQPFTIEKNQGTVYIANPEQLVKQLHPYIKTKFTNSINFNSVDREHVQVTYSNNLTNLNVKDFISFLFDPQPNMVEVQELQNKIGSAFPIPFPYTAGLNYI